MAKTKTPFLSFGSSGTVGGSLTSQKRGSATILRSKPIPTDPYSLKQAYQRWDYRDYAYLWTLLSNSEKQVYRTRGSRYHITGFSQWMREKLKDLPDLVGRWRFDKQTGAIAYDSSKQGNHGTIYGASPILGAIDHGLYFDGVNDYVRIPGAPSLHPTEKISIEFFATPHVSSGIWNFIVSSDLELYWLGLHTTLKRIYFKAGPLTLNTGSNMFDLDTLQHFTVTFDSTLPNSNVLFYVNGLLVATRNNTNPMAPTPLFLHLGTSSSLLLNYDHKGLLDHICIYNRTLDPTEVNRHSKRRYPPQ